MLVEVRIDADTLVEMLVDRVEYWTDDEETKELFEAYYENMVYGGCFSGGEFDVKSIVDNDYVNNTRVLDRDEVEQMRSLYLDEEAKSGDYTEEELEELEEDTPHFDDLECGEISSVDYLNGDYIEAKTDNLILIN